LNNQDPLNPMDNAQMTSQLAQINTASGVSDLNQTLKGVSQQLGSQMMLYGASLVGREVLTSGNTLNLSQGQASAAFELPADAQAVQVRVTSAGGQLMDTLNLGALASGRQSFTWNASNASDGPYSFEVRARNGAQTLTATPLSHSTVKSVSLDSAGLRIDTGSASRLTLSDIQAIL
jgi:flagellar basal-body rod modification protein FlgD